MPEAVFIAVYRSDALKSAEQSIIEVGPVRIEVVKRDYTLRISSYLPVVLPSDAEAGSEFCIPSQPPIKMGSKNKHIILSTATQRGRSQEGAAECEESIDRIIALISCFSSRNAFRTLLFRGWLYQPDQASETITAIVPPVVWHPGELRKAFEVAKKTLTGSPDLYRRFSLMAKFFRKALAEPPGSEEAFLWLWTVLEVFPMKDQTHIRSICNHLGSYLCREPAFIEERLRIPWLYSLRCNLVHQGKIAVPRKELLAVLNLLENLVEAVLKSMLALPYAGNLDPYLDEMHGITLPGSFGKRASRRRQRNKST